MASHSSVLENSMDRETWLATVHEVTKSQAQVTERTQSRQMKSDWESSSFSSESWRKTQTCSSILFLCEQLNRSVLNTKLLLHIDILKMQSYILLNYFAII